jgi:Histidine kinase-, DNA gyrase B-, and HSP90-like ATPase
VLAPSPGTFNHVFPGELPSAPEKTGTSSTASVTTDVWLHAPRALDGFGGQVYGPGKGSQVQSCPGAQKGGLVTLTVALGNTSSWRFLRVHGGFSCWLGAVPDGIGGRSVQQVGQVGSIYCSNSQGQPWSDTDLVSNACEAISGAEHRSRDAQLAITVSTEQTSDNQVEIRIRDTGTGIPREDFERIFEPFFTTKAAGEGTGLGLAISRDIVLKHEGQISVHSDPGKFTEFVVALPIAPAPVGASV